MNLILFLLLVTAGEAAYIEYTIAQQTSAGFQKQESAWQSEVTSLQMDSRELKDAKAQTQVRIEDEQTRVMAGAKAPANGAAPTAPATVAPTTETTDAVIPPPAVGSELGNIVSVSGDTFVNCKLLKVEPDGVTFSHASGIRKLLFTDMSPEAQKRFGHDPNSAPEPAPQSMGQ